MTVPEAIARFVDWMNAKDDEGYTYAVHGNGSKFTRIARSYGAGLSVHCFIDNATGDVLKADGWKRPARGARGNLITGWDDITARWDRFGGYLYAR